MMKAVKILLWLLSALAHAESAQAQKYWKEWMGTHDSVYVYFTSVKTLDSGLFEYRVNDSMPDGKWIVYREADKEIAFIGYYRNCKKDSVWLMFYGPHKVMAQLRYTDGKLNGLCSWYYPDGRKAPMTGFYKHGVKTESRQAQTRTKRTVRGLKRQTKKLKE